MRGPFHPSGAAGSVNAATARLCDDPRRRHHPPSSTCKDMVSEPETLWVLNSLQMQHTRTVLCGVCIPPREHVCVGRSGCEAG